jgi:hypothetical protein
MYKLDFETRPHAVLIAHSYDRLARFVLDRELNVRAAT